MPSSGGCRKILNMSFIMEQIGTKAATRWSLKCFRFRNFKIIIIYLYKWWQCSRALHRPSLNAPYSLNLLWMGPWVTRFPCLRILFLPSWPGSLFQSLAQRGYLPIVPSLGRVLENTSCKSRKGTWVLLPDLAFDINKTMPVCEISLDL